MDTWHILRLEDALGKLQSDSHSGLNRQEAHKRLSQYGENELIDLGTKSLWKILFEQFTGVMVLMLIISAIISALLGEYIDAIAILLIILLNTILGFSQEYKAEKAMAALKQMAVPHVRVRRDGHIQDISARDLVPGDVVLLEAGNYVPADGRLLEAVNLRIQEAVLTGESEPVEKHTDPIDEEILPIGDQRNMVFMGTSVSYGRGTLVVTDTGMRTQLGLIATMIQAVGQEKTPLQKRLEQLGKGLALASLAIVAVVFLLGILRGEPVRLMFMTAISMAVAAVPEGLPAVVTIALALGAQRMLQRKALIRKLPAVETLGSVTVICSDKTGTLTENRMTVTILDIAGCQMDLKDQLHTFTQTIDLNDAPVLDVNQQLALPLLLTGGALCNDATLEPVPGTSDEFAAVGDPTEGALVLISSAAGLWKSQLEEKLPRVAELPFDSERKRMSTLHDIASEDLPAGLASVAQKYPHTKIQFTKGAVDSLLEVSDRVWNEDHEEPLDSGWTQRIQHANDQLAQKGMRVLGICYRLWDDRVNTENPVESNLVFVGMTGLIDPARPEVRSAVHTTRSAGINPIMITGDHPLTALYIARDLGISRDESVLTGQKLATLDIEMIKEHLSHTAVFARVSPEHKLKIVQALQEMGHVVAMTGDGVNDAPALKKADIGVAMGITGTDVSKEAADMVLLDDNFATIVAAVEEGRRIYDNIRKFVKYTMTSNAGEIWVMLLAPFLGMPLPLLPLQILWVNLVTDGLPGLALTIEPAEKDTMQRPPHPPRESIFARGMTWDIIWIGLLMGGVSLALGFWAWSSGIDAWQTMVFTTLTLSQMGNVLAIRSDRQSLFSIGLFSNPMILGSVFLTFLLQLGVIYLPFFQQIFKTQALTLNEFVISLLASTIVFIGVELRKQWRKRKAS